MRLVKSFCLLVPGLAMLFIASSIARADDVTDWNQHMLRAGTVAGTPPIVMTRVAAIVQASVFDAVNGIDRKYTPVHVPAGAAAGASRRAAIVEAAYTALVALYPTQKGTFDARLAVSLTAIAVDPHETSAGIASGIAWGQAAANGILSWRATDGFTPAPAPFLGGTGVGEWRPTPPAFLPGAVPQFAYMTPWSISSPSQFRPDGPPALTSARYTMDFNETKMMGSISSATRTADQTIYAWFWNASTVSYLGSKRRLHHDCTRHSAGSWKDAGGASRRVCCAARRAQNGQSNRGGHFGRWAAIIAIRAAPSGSLHGAPARLGRYGAHSRA